MMEGERMSEFFGERLSTTVKLGLISDKFSEVKKVLTNWSALLDGARGCSDLVCGLLFNQFEVIKDNLEELRLIVELMEQEWIARMDQYELSTRD